MSQKPTIKDMQHLEQALLRYGYTQEASYSYMDANGYIHDVLPPRADCMQVKPYHLYISPGGVLEIHHGFSCERRYRNGWQTHAQRFLQELATVIGKLDAEAQFDPGDSGRGPRLRIYL